MIARTLPARTAEEVARVVRALGSHRYVAGRLLLVHAFVLDALSGANVPELADACAWAAATLATPGLDVSSRDERLHRRATERELAAVLAAFWSEDEAATRAHARLRACLDAIDEPAPRAEDLDESALFDESLEEDVFPVLVDAGWELLPLAALDPERHRGAIDAFGAPSELARALRDEATRGDPHLHELPLLGPAELLYGAEHVFRNALVLWTEGNETYDDYVLRGVLRAAKLD